MVDTIDIDHAGFERFLLGVDDAVVDVPSPRARRIPSKQLALEQALGVGGHGG